MLTRKLFLLGMMACALGMSAAAQSVTSPPYDRLKSTAMDAVNDRDYEIEDPFFLQWIRQNNE